MADSISHVPCTHARTCARKHAEASTKELKEKDDDLDGVDCSGGDEEEQDVLGHVPLSELSEEDGDGDDSGVVTEDEDTMREMLGSGILVDKAMAALGPQRVRSVLVKLGLRGEGGRGLPQDSGRVARVQAAG